jgi:hypothetical protein
MVVDYIALLYTFLTTLAGVLRPVAVGHEGLRFDMDIEAELSTPSYCRRSQSQMIVLLIHVRARAKGEVGSRHRVFEFNDSASTAVNARTLQVIRSLARTYSSAF